MSLDLKAISRKHRLIEKWIALLAVLKLVIHRINALNNAGRSIQDINAPRQIIRLTHSYVTLVFRLGSKLAMLNAVQYLRTFQSLDPFLKIYANLGVLHRRSECAQTAHLAPFAFNSLRIWDRQTILPANSPSSTKEISNEVKEHTGIYR